MSSNAIYCHDIYGYLNEIAPFSSAENFDNVGLMVGREWAEVKGVLVCLDATKEAIKKAEEVGANLIVSHHPLIFSPIKNVCESSFGTESLVFELCKKDISVISSHTCLDVAENGVAFNLAKALKLSNTQKFALSEKSGRFGEALYFGRYGLLPREMGFEELSGFIKDCLSLDSFTVSKNAKGKTFKSLACLGGSGGSFLKEVDLLKKEGKADVFVTSDIKHNQWLDAERAGITLIDAGHFMTERVVVKPLTELLKSRFECIPFFSFEEESSPFIFK